MRGYLSYTKGRSHLGRFFSRAYTLLDIGHFLLQFVITYAFNFLSIYIATLLDTPKGALLSPKQWWIISCGALILVFFIYFRELLVFSKKEQTINDQKIIYDLIGGAIGTIVKSKNKPENERKTNINELLKYCEKIIELVLKNNGENCSGKICANLMVPENSGTSLKLRFWGTVFPDRDDISLAIDEERPLPGAPEAFIRKKVTYVNDTESEKFKNFFDGNKPYKSIISIPVRNNASEIFAVMNIDSDVANQFNSIEFINKKILTTVKPILELVRLIQEEFTK